MTRSPYDGWPAFQEQDVAVIQSAGKILPVQITFAEPLPLSQPLKQDLGAITAGSTAGPTEITTVALTDNQLLQLRFKPLDDVQLSLNQPRGSARFTTNRSTIANVSLNTGIFDPQWKSTTF